MQLTRRASALLPLGQDDVQRKNGGWGIAAPRTARQGESVRIKNGEGVRLPRVPLTTDNWDYIIPPMSPPPGMGFSGSGMSVTSAEVVRIIAAIELAFSTALRVTLAGSMMPASSMST